jgi:hypothetical protein
MLVITYLALKERDPSAQGIALGYLFQIHRSNLIDMKQENDSWTEVHQPITFYLSAD